MKLQRLKLRLKPLPRLFTPLVTESARLTGRRGVERRKRHLQLHPLCWACEREGKVTAGDVADHTVPLWAGGADDESNLGTLCQIDAKSACEAKMRAAGGWMSTPCTCGLHENHTPAQAARKDHERQPPPLPHMHGDVLRRTCLDQRHPVEVAMREAQLAVKALPGDPTLTTAVVLLGQARNLVSDWLEGSQLTAAPTSGGS